MATTSPDNLYSPNSNDPYALVQDLGAMQSSVQNALIQRANAYRGTSAQRNAFTNAPVGTIWSDTNGDRLVWKKGAVGWKPISPEPLKILAGTIFVSPVANTYTSERVSFPSGFFTSDNIAVTVNAYTTSPAVQSTNPSNISRTGADIGIIRTNTTNTTLMWIAMQVG